MNRVVTLPVLRVGSDGTVDQVVVEEPLEILVNGRNLAITMRTPGHDEELATGFLFTEGLLRSSAEIRKITTKGNRVELELTIDVPERQNRNFTMTSACGVCGKLSIDSLYATGCTAIPPGEFAIRMEKLHTLPEILKQSQTVFAQTGGIHAAALFDGEGRLEFIREDVGRHNAVDKLIGACFADAKIPLGNRVVVVSGRASFELVQKAIMAGIPLLAAVGAPSSMAVETASRFGMTLVGFLNRNRFNIYCGGERIGMQNTR